MIRKLLVAALVLVTLHLGVSLARALAGSTPAAPSAVPHRLMPAAGGPVQELGLQFHRPAHERFLPVFGQMLQALDPATTVRVVVADAEDERLFESARAGWFPGGAGPRVTYARTGQPITSWMRDRLAVLSGPGGRATLLSPLTAHTGATERVNDFLVPWVLGDHLGDRAGVVRAGWRFDGGDLIADTDRVYVADPLLAQNPEADPARLLRTVAKDTGRPVLHLGTTGDVPDHHIGMFLTPLGDGRVMVGDPDLALPLIGDATQLPVGGAPLELDRTPDRLERFRRVARELAAAGLEVLRVPVMPAVNDYVFLSYNNVLCDRRQGRLHVLLPVYGVPALDAAAVRGWEAAGAVVHPIDVSRVFRYGGSVRCLCAPLVRGPLGRPRVAG